MKICIENKDRHGLVHDITKILLEFNVNIVSMEVIKNTIYLETETLSSRNEQLISNRLQGLPGIVNINKIILMPHDEKYQQMDIVFNTINEGIVITDKHGHIRYINDVALNILKIKNPNVIGQYITKALPFCKSLEKTLATGKKIFHHEVYSKEYDNNYIVSSQPILSDNKNLSGAVAVIRDIKIMRELYQKITGQPSTNFDDIIHQSSKMQMLIQSAQNYATSNSTVIIRGETGTGKELFARAIHNASSRRDNIFLAINCTAIPDNLLESELFGYEEGTFTGANKGGKLGLFELASGGTIFLDEIGDISSTLQAKLLRVLQEHTVRRLGGTREIPIDVRVISATNRNLEEMVLNHDFRQDLYYRLNVIPLFIPALRERREDIRLLANHLLKTTASKLQSPVKQFSAKALAKLEAYEYPGNIRELSNIIERAINLTQTSTIEARDIQLTSIAFVDKHNSIERTDNAMAIDNTNWKLDDTLRQAEYNLLSKAIHYFPSSRKMGQALGISHTSVIRKLKEHNLHNL